MTEPTSYAVIAARLAELRRNAGNPSYTDLVKRVRDVRAARGVPESQQTPGRITVYDCFKPERRRFDIDLVVDVARALGVEGDGVREWELTCWAVQHHVDASRIVHVQTDVPDPLLRFVGRASELVALTANPARRVHVVHGMAGSGKTELVWEAARRLLAAGDARMVVFADLRGFDPDRPAADPRAVLDAIVRLLDGGQHRMSAKRDRTRTLGRLLAERGALLVLDNAESASQVRPLLPEHRAVRVFVTSRHSIADDLDADAVGLGVLAPDDAAEFLGAVAGPAAAGWQRDDLVGLAEAVGRLPLALSVLGARIAHRSGWNAADHAQSLIGHDGEVRLDQAVAAALDQSHASVSQRASRALRFVASQPFDHIGLDTLAVAVGVDQATATAIGDELVTANMVSRSSRARLAIHALVRAHARERSLDLDRASDRSASLAAVLDHFVVNARSAAVAAVPGRVGPPRYPMLGEVDSIDEHSAIAWLDDEFENLLAATGESCQAHRPSVAVELAESLGWYVERSSRHHDAIILCDRAVAAARSLGDQIGEGRAEICRGQSYVRLGELERGAISLRSAEILVADDHRDLARVKLALGALAFQASDWQASLDYLLEAIKLNEAGGAPGDLARNHGNIAVLYSRIGEFDRAADHLRQAASYANDAGDMESAAYIWMNTSGTHLLRGDPAAALEAADRSIALCNEYGVRAALAPAGNNRAGALAELGRTDEAIDQAKLALVDAQQDSDRYAEADVYVNLGEIYLAAGRLDDAARELATALDLAVELNDAYQRGRVLAASGHVAKAGGDVDQARTSWSAALEAFDDSVPEAAPLREALAAISTDRPS